MFAQTTRIISFAALAFVLIITAGCGQQDQDTSKTTHKSHSSDIGVVLAKKVDSGEWELGEALVNTLKIYANEASTKDVYGTTNIRVREKGGTIRIAKRYLKDGKNEQHKKEIRRLLKILSRKNDEIRKNAIPIEKLKNSGLLHDRQQLVSKLTRFFIGNAVAAPPDGTYGVIDWDLNGNTHQIYFPADWQTSQSSLNLVYSIKDAINKSISTFENFFPRSSTDPIEVIIDTEATDEGYADEVDQDDYCEITVYKLSIDKGASFTQQTVAHEVFHCYQDWNLEDQASAVGATWWVEGSAEYFSSVAYKCTNFEWTEYGGVFDAESGDKSITEMDVANFVFFLYLSQSGSGDKGVISLLKSMPTIFTSGGLNAQIRALGSYGNMSKVFHQFGRDYIDKKIKDRCSSSRGVLYRPGAKEDEKYEIDKSEEFTIKAKPFHLARRILTFKEGNIYFVSEEQGPPKAKSASRERRPANIIWFPLPKEVISACGEEEYIFLVTNATRTTQESTTRIKVTSNLSDASASTKPDKCLIGTWELINPSHEQRLLAFWKKIDKNATHSTSGKLRLKFNKRCKVTAIHKNFRNTSRLVMNRVRFRGDGNANGSGTATYVARDGLLQYANIQDGTCTQTDTIANVDGMNIRFSEKECGGKIVSKSGPQIPGMPKNMPVMPPGMPGFDGGGFPMPGGGMPDMDSMKPDTPELERKFAAQERYECSKNTLRLQPVMPGMALPFEEYKRISKKKERRDQGNDSSQF